MRRTLLWLAAAAALCYSCNPADTGETATETGDERFRPQFHFSPRTNWTNDPNGLVYHQGVYHLFFQHYPDSNVWGPMHWGHATSKDLVTWTREPIALYPDSLGMIFSGSAVVDHNNTSGLGSSDNPPIVAIYSYHNEAEDGDYLQYQGIAYSTDNGDTWTKYENNPVLNPEKKDFRDPKVFWHKPSGAWVMILAVYDHVELYTSPDLKEWTYASSFGKDIGAHGGAWECPDLFELNVEGTDEKRWVMLVSTNPGGPNEGSGTQYFIGDFDGKTFVKSSEQEQDLWLDYGKDNYAGVTWSDIPEEDGRRIFIGWMSNWQYANVVPTYTWRNAMTFPRELSLYPTPSGLRVASRPVRELASIRMANGADTFEDFMNEDEKESEPILLPSSQQEFLIAIERSDAAVDFELVFSNPTGETLTIGLDGSENEYFIDRTDFDSLEFSPDFAGRHTGARWSDSTQVNMRILLDVASVELFADEGTSVMTGIFFPQTPFNTLYIKAPDGGVTVTSLKRNELRSIWQ